MDWTFFDRMGMSEKAKARARESYNNIKRPIYKGEPNKELVGLIQMKLHVKGYPLPKSVVCDPTGCVCDGVFAKETFDAVIQFQIDNHLVHDGMIGEHTWDALVPVRRTNPPDPPMPSPPVERPRRYICPPGKLICPEPQDQ